MANELDTQILYDGKVKLQIDHTDSKHLYLVSKLLPKDVWSEPVPKEGVNKFLNVIPKYLLQWSANEASKHWLQALKNGLQPEQYAETYDEARMKHSVLSKAGMSRGTSLHDIVERWLSGTPTDELLTEDLDEDVVKQFQKFMAWWGGNGWEAKAVELPCYSLSLDYCGKTDILATTPAGKTVLCDVKSTKSGVYLENFLQLGGYALALLEEGSLDDIDDLAILNPNVKDEDGNMQPILASHFGLSVEEAIRVFSLCKLLTDELEKWQLKYKDRR